MKRAALTLSFLLSVTLSAACGDDVGSASHSGHDHGDHGHDDHGHDPNEVMTTVNLTFTPASGAEAFTAVWENIDEDDTPNVDDITLVAGEVYAVDVTILNELTQPAEDVTIELRDELDEHQTFWVGPAVSSPASDVANPIITHAYDDEDANGFPVGLTNTVEATAAGEGVLTFMLRHLPPINGVAVKTGTLADTVKAACGSDNAGCVDGFADLPGSSDIEVQFNVTVQ